MSCFLLINLCQHFTCSSLSPEDGLPNTTQVTWWEKQPGESSLDQNFCCHVHFWHWHTCDHVYRSKQFYYINTRAAEIPHWHFLIGAYGSFWVIMLKQDSLPCFYAFLENWQSKTVQLAGYLQPCSLASSPGILLSQFCIVVITLPQHGEGAKTFLKVQRKKSN